MKEKYCRDCGADLALESHRQYCEPYFDEDALREQANHERHFAREDAMGVPDDQR